MSDSKYVDILLVDDDEAVRDSLSEYLESMGWNVKTADCAEKGLKIVEEGYGDIVLSDVRMPGMDGIEFLRNLKQLNPDLEVLIITGHSNEALAIEALKAGAFDYFRKPINPREVISSLEKTSAFQLLKKENRNLKALLERFNHIDDRHNFLGDGPVSRHLLNRLERVAKVPEATVLLSGESGTGKEVAARLIHRLSRNPGAPFIAINCGAVAENILESELFGHEKGAFTGADKMKPGIFEMAQGGTVLLDEISEMSMHAQSRFLRVLEERRYRRVGGVKEIDIKGIRIIAATNKNLDKLVEEEKFRHDLLFRVNVARIDIPTLKERKDDIADLAEYFLEEQRKIQDRNFQLTDAAFNSLKEYEFPGNIRELRNLIEKAAIFAATDTISPSDLGLGLANGEESVATLCAETLNLAENECSLLQEALRRNPGNHSAAARELGITPQSLYRKIDKYKI